MSLDTYDANGAMTALPAPYSVSAVTYDPRGMATKVVASGNTTYYRYNSAGERYWKKTTSGADYYALDGALQLGVFSSTGTLRHWNVIAGGRVVGRYDGSVKKYYHTDHLGTTRSVVEGSCTGGSCTIREARDYDAWGIELDGRTYLSGTVAIEGFTGKERDSETGLDYFGARYYMPSVGRWNAVDPLADKYPGWSPYNYVLNNPLMLVDPDGMMVDGCEPLCGPQGEIVRDEARGLANTAGNKLSSLGNGFSNLLSNPGKVLAELGSEAGAELKQIGSEIASEASNIADGIDDVATGVAVIGILAAPLTGGATLATVTGPALTAGTYADVASTAIKGTEVMVGSGSGREFARQAIETGIDFMTARTGRFVAGKVLARSGLTTPGVLNGGSSFSASSRQTLTTATADATAVGISTLNLQNHVVSDRE